MGTVTRYTGYRIQVIISTEMTWLRPIQERISISTPDSRHYPIVIKSSGGVLIVCKMEGKIHFLKNLTLGDDI